jgi:hypothetical protein
MKHAIYNQTRKADIHTLDISANQANTMQRATTGEVFAGFLIIIDPSAG